VGWLGSLFLRSLGTTWRIRIDGDDPFLGHAPFVAATWHQGALVAAYTWRDRGLAIPVSQSRDGDLMDAALARMGFAQSPRGSSSRGSTSLLRSMIRRVRAGELIGMLPDGPRGPARQAKPGVIALSRSGGVPLIPVGIAAAPALRFASWDRAILPLPFARVKCRYGPALQVPKSASASEMEACRRELEKRLDALEREMNASLGRPARPAVAERHD
jgi:lysophospholipid acyltransferase (LPLAT)-like uncharacterized protein